MTNYSKCFHEIPYEDVDNISKKIYHYLLAKLDFGKKVFFSKIDIFDIIDNISEFKNAINFLGLIPNQGYIVIVKSGYNGGIHVDYLHGLRVLFPVYNCAHTVTSFYNVSEEDLELTTDRGMTWYKIKAGKNYNVINKFTLQTFTIINPTIAHSIGRIDLGDYRISLTWSCKNPLDRYLI